MRKQSFSSEIKALKQGKAIPVKSKIAYVRPSLDNDGILRAEGRATTIDKMLFNNNPVILDSKHEIVKLLLKHYHHRFFHASNETVINELRQKYYIIGLRNALKSLNYKCLIFKIRKAKPQNPMMASLPTGRVAFQQRAFTHCGIDYFGLMYEKIGRRRKKRWGVLFTCLTTRAIHLELAHSLDASSAIMALQRLAARRGSPSVIYSDNGTNFRGACTELQDEVTMIDRNKQREYALQNGIKWLFNPPDAPHMGGAWERLIQSVKKALSTVLNEQAPTEEVLYTVLVEIEHSVNSRPLTHVSTDPRDNESLTPNHFLIGSSSGEFKFGNYDAQNTCLRKQYRIAQAFAESFWKRWLREYLPTLIAREKWYTQKEPLKIGDKVLIVDNQAPRNLWKKGTILETFPGANGEIRVAKILTFSGEMTRPTHKLVRLFAVKDVQN